MFGGLLTRFFVREIGFDFLHRRPPPFPLMATPHAGTGATRSTGLADGAGSNPFLGVAPSFELAQPEAATFGDGFTIYHLARVHGSEAGSCHSG